FNVSVEVSDGHGHVVTSSPVALTVTSVASQLSQLRQQYGFYASGNYFQNFLGQGFNEKWIQDRTGAWYVIRTDGRVQPWLGRTSLGSPVATVNPQVWGNPNLLLQADLTSFLSPANASQLSALRQQKGFYSADNHYHNFLG